MTLFYKRPHTTTFLIIGIAMLTGAASTGCDDSFTPASVIERLRILGIQMNTPEICPFGLEQCPAETYGETVKIAILAADENGLVADGLHPDGPFLREDHQLQWALCQYGLRGTAVDSPDCTQDQTALFSSQEPIIELPLTDLITRLMPHAGDPGAQDPAQDELPEDLALTIMIGAAVNEQSMIEREWGIKQLTLSTSARQDQNENPSLTEVMLGGVPLRPGNDPLVEVETGQAYRITWQIPDQSWQRFEVRKPDGVVIRKERPILNFWSNGGSFSHDYHVDIWMAVEEENELYWRPPLEVPENGREVTLFFNLLDQRGGSSWTWGKVRVVRGKTIMPR